MYYDFIILNKISKLKYSLIYFSLSQKLQFYSQILFFLFFYCIYFINLNYHKKWFCLCWELENFSPVTNIVLILGQTPCSSLEILFYWIPILSLVPFPSVVGHLHLLLHSFASLIPQVLFRSSKSYSSPCVLLKNNHLLIFNHPIYSAIFSFHVT